MSHQMDPQVTAAIAKLKEAVDRHVVARGGSPIPLSQELDDTFSEIVQAAFDTSDLNLTNDQARIDQVFASAVLLIHESTSNCTWLTRKMVLMSPRLRSRPTS